jgi:hypothetical protein
LHENDGPDAAEQLTTPVTVQAVVLQSRGLGRRSPPLAVTDEVTVCGPEVRVALDCDVTTNPAGTFALMVGSAVVRVLVLRTRVLLWGSRTAIGTQNWTATPVVVMVPVIDWPSSLVNVARSEL